MAIRWHTESRNRHNQSNTDAISNFISCSPSFSLTFSSSPFISPLICSPLHDRNPSPSIGTQEYEGKRDWRRRRVDIWLEHLHYKSEVKTPDEDMPWFYKVIYWWQKQQNLDLPVCMLNMYKSVHVFLMSQPVCVCNKSAFTFKTLFFISIFITWPGSCLVEQWPNVSCCPCWRPRLCHWPEPHSQSWPRPHEVKRSCGRRRAVGWRNPRTGKLGRSGRQAHRLDH